MATKQDLISKATAILSAVTNNTYKPEVIDNLDRALQGMDTLLINPTLQVE